MAKCPLTCDFAGSPRCTVFEPRRDSRWAMDPAQPARQLAGGAPRASVRWLTWNLNCRSRRRGTHGLRSARRAPLGQLISRPPGDSSIGGRNGPLPLFWLLAVCIAAQGAADLVSGRPYTILPGSASWPPSGRSGMSVNGSIGVSAGCAAIGGSSDLVGAAVDRCQLPAPERSGRGPWRSARIPVRAARTSSDSPT